MTDAPSWGVPATLDDMRPVFKALLPLWPEGCDLRPVVQSMDTTAKILIAAGLTKQEIRFGIKGMLLDKHFAWVFIKGEKVVPNMIAPFAHELRKLQASLLQPMNAKTRNRLLVEFPDELKVEHFGVCGFAPDGISPMYAYRYQDRIRAEFNREARLQEVNNPNQLSDFLMGYTETA